MARSAAQIAQDVLSQMMLHDINKTALIEQLTEDLDKAKKEIEALKAPPGHQEG